MGIYPHIVPDTSRQAGPSPAPANDVRSLRGLAHDLRGLVTIVKGYAELIADGGDGGQQREFSGSILRACTMMTDMLESCLDYDQLEAGPVMRRREVEPGVFVHDLVAVYAVRARSKGIRLEAAVEENLPRIQADPVWLERALGNLISNALKFSKADTTVTVAARLRAGMVELEVRDEGPGIALQEIPLLFVPYHRGSSRPTGGEKGTGLGLVIVKKLAEAMGGALDLASEVGRGSSFRLLLPVPEAAPALAV